MGKMMKVSFSGVCLCADGWIGADCSVDISAGPRVSHLANNGLCDVRSKPCRSVLVSGDNFADNDKLVCHMEVFKVENRTCLEQFSLKV